MSFKSIKVNVNKKNSNLYTSDDLKKLSKDELIERIQTLQAHNIQLKNLLAQKENSPKTVPIRKSKKPFDFTKCHFRHIFIKLLYLGWDYNGFVVQEDSTNTIEHYLFEALLKTCLIKDRKESNYHRCGRTDKGVSSAGQVISITVRSKLSSEEQNNLLEEFDYCQMLNSILPDNVQCIAWAPVSEGLSARFDCLNRTYKYYFPKAGLNINKMQVAAEYLKGTHDFRNLCKMDVGNGVTEFTRSISEAKIESFSDENTSESMQVAIITSKGFLWHQIRCIMALLFLIGENKEEPEIISQLFNVEKNPNKPDYGMASEIPLNLFNCQYENVNWQWNKTTLESTLNKLRQQWTVAIVKTSMMQNMIKDMEKLWPNVPTKNFLSTDVKTKVYVPLMKRKKCDSLEDKIRHFVKRNRIQLAENE